MKFTTIQPQHYAEGIELTKSAMKEIYGVDVDMKFNFQIKNTFIMPGNISRAILIDNEMVGFYLLEQNYSLWNDQKSLTLLYFYIKPEHRSDENYAKIQAHIDDYAITNGYSSFSFSDSVPFFGEYLKNNTEAKQSTTVYERQI